MNRMFLFVVMGLLGVLAHADDSGLIQVGEAALIERTTILSGPETSSWIQAGLQERGYAIRFVQAVEEGLKHYQASPQYLRVIVFDPPTTNMPVGVAGDQLHVFVPLRVAVAAAPQGARVSSMSYGKVASALPEEAAQVMLGWHEDIVSVMTSLPD